MTRPSCDECPDEDACIATTRCPLTGEPLTDDDAPEPPPALHPLFEEILRPFAPRTTR